MGKRYFFIILFFIIFLCAYYIGGCGGPDEQKTPKFYKVSNILIDNNCGSTVEFFNYTQRSPINNPVTVAVYNKGKCPITLITDQPGGTGRVERIKVVPDIKIEGSIREKTGVVTFDILVDKPMKFIYECGGNNNDKCVGEIAVYENMHIDNPVGFRVTDEIRCFINIEKRHSCGIFNETVFEYRNTSSQTQELKFETYQYEHVWPDPTDWWGYACFMRFWGFAVPPTGTLMDTIYVDGNPKGTTVDIPGRRTFYLTASCLRSPDFPDTTGNFCVGDVTITIKP